MDLPSGGRMPDWRGVSDGTPLTITQGPAGHPPQRCDPYLLWAAATGFVGFAVPTPVAETGGSLRWRYLSAVLELDRMLLAEAERASRQPWWKLLWSEHRVWTMGAYMDLTTAASRSKSPFLYASALVRSSRWLSVLERTGFVRRMVLSLPRNAARDALTGVPAHPFPGPQKVGSANKPVLAVIDDLCPFLHAQFKGADGKTRWRYLWDQDAGASGRWRVPVDFGYGRELTGEVIDGLLGEHAGAAADPAKIYASLDFPARVDPMRNGRSVPPVGAKPLPRSSHGALCAALAAGADAAIPGGSAGDAAASADLIFVQLPSETVADTSGGSLATYVLDALRYIVERVDAQAPLVVSLSYGAAAGPHDGSSILERAIAQLHQERANMAVVVPAGNLYSEDGPEEARRDRRLHARLEIGPLEFQELNWEIPAESGSDHFMELWPDGGQVVASELLVALQPPGAAAMPEQPVGPGEAWFMPMPDSESVQAAVISSLDSPLGAAAQGAGAPMVLVAVARTTEVDGAPPARPGTWKVLVYNGGLQPAVVHAWIERCDATFGGRGRQSVFPEGQNGLTGDSTLASLANAREAVVVGGCVGEDSASPKPAAYSSSGPGRGPRSRLGPDFSMTCERSESEPWLVLPGCHEGDWVRASGTSLAAPRAARLLLKAIGSTGSRARALAWLKRHSAQAPTRADKRLGVVL